MHSWILAGYRINSGAPKLSARTCTKSNGWLPLHFINRLQNTRPDADYLIRGTQMNKRRFAATSAIAVLLVSSFAAVPPAQASTLNPIVTAHESAKRADFIVPGNQSWVTPKIKTISGSCVAQASRVVTATLGAMTGSVSGPLGLLYGWMKFVNVIVAEPKSQNGAYFVC